MRKTIYANEEHQQAIETYLIMCEEFVKETSTKVRYQNYIGVIDLILEYHNNYGSGTKEHNFFDWLMIIPINLSVATNGFFAGLETNRNRATVRAYKTILNEVICDVVDKIDNLQEQSE